MSPVPQTQVMSVQCEQKGTEQTTLWGFCWSTRVNVSVYVGLEYVRSVCDEFRYPTAECRIQTTVLKGFTQKCKSSY